MSKRALGQTDGPACPKPGYARTFFSGGLFTLVMAPFVVAGAAVAATSDPKLKAALIDAIKGQAAVQVPGAPPAPSITPAAAAAIDKLDMRRVIAGAIAGGAVGIVPALYAQRALLRTPECPRPGMGRLLGYNVIKYGVVAGAGYAGTKLWPAGGRSAARTVTAIGMPLVGVALLRNTGRNIQAA